MKKWTFSILVLVLMVMGFGCTCNSSLQKVTGPLQTTYDIQYMDDTALSIDLMVLSPVISSKSTEIQENLDVAVNEVARKLPKSVILSRQDKLRTELDNSFRKNSEDQIHLVVLDVHEIDSQQANAK